MKMKKSIFYGLIVAGFTAVFVMPSFAADDACMSEDNDAIAAPFAMCSTHAYNIGMTENPNSADRALMKEVIGLKTTFFTQQLYKQYDQLESMVRRLKTQLKKAVLTNNLKAAGAKSEKDDDSSSYSASKNDYVQISGAKDCTTSWSKKEIFDCLAGNYTLIKNGDKSTAYKKQLKQDYNLACENVAKDNLCLEKDDKTDVTKKKDVCRGTITNNNFSNCLNNLYSLIVAGKEVAADKEAERYRKKND